MQPCHPTRKIQANNTLSGCSSSARAGGLEPSGRTGSTFHPDSFIYTIYTHVSQRRGDSFRNYKVRGQDSPWVPYPFVAQMAEAVVSKTTQVPVQARRKGPCCYSKDSSSIRLKIGTSQSVTEWQHHMEITRNLDDGLALKANARKGCRIITMLSPPIWKVAERLRKLFAKQSPERVAGSTPALSANIPG